MVTLATGLEVEIEGTFLFTDTGKRDGSVNKARQKERLVRFVGVICTNQFKIGTGSHNVAFTFISFLKRNRKKMKMLHQSQSDVWYAIREKSHCLETFDLAVKIRKHF